MRIVAEDGGHGDRADPRDPGRRRAAALRARRGLHGRGADRGRHRPASARPTWPGRSPRWSRTGDLRPGPARQRRRRHRRLPGRHPAGLPAGPAGGERGRGRSRSTGGDGDGARARDPTASRRTRCPLPAVVTVLEGGVEPRYPSITGRMKAKKAKIETVAPRAEPRRLRAGAAHAAARAAEHRRGARRGAGRRARRGRPAAAPGGGAMILVFVEADAGGADRGVAGDGHVRPHARRADRRPGARRRRRGAAGRRWSTSSARTGSQQVHHAVGDAFSAYGGAAWAAARAGGRGWTGDRCGRRGRVLAPGTPRGMEVLAHLAARLDVAMAANVAGDRRDRQRPFVVTRQVLGGRCSRRCSSRPPRRAHRRRARRRGRPAGEPGRRRVHEFTPEVAEADLVARVVSTETVRSRTRPARSRSARVVVGAGRGAGSPTGSTRSSSWRSCSTARSASPAW